MHTLTLQYTVPASATAIRPYFLDFEKFGALHPYMKEVKKLDENTYSIHERLFVFGIIPMRPRYKAKVFEIGGEICYTSDVRRNVDLKIRFLFTEDAASNQTQITEILEVKANSFIAMVFLDILKKSHKIVVENLEKTVKNNFTL